MELIFLNNLHFIKLKYKRCEAHNILIILYNTSVLFELLRLKWHFSNIKNTVSSFYLVCATDIIPVGGVWSM